VQHIIHIRKVVLL